MTLEELVEYYIGLGIDPEWAEAKAARIFEKLEKGKKKGRGKSK